MNRFHIGQTVYAVKQKDDGTEDTDHRFGYNSLMDRFASGVPGVIVHIDDENGCISVDAGNGSWNYSEMELSETPRCSGVHCTAHVDYAPETRRVEVVVKEKRKKVVDGARKTLYAIIKQGELVGVHLTREDARQAKASIGGLYNGVTIVTYQPQKEIR